MRATTRASARVLTAVGIVASAIGCAVPCSARASRVPVTVTGQFAYQNYIVAKYFQANPTVALLCVSASLRSPSNAYVPRSQQILGRLTTPVTPSPLKFEIPLPMVPPGEFVDLDNNGRKDVGVQVFAAIMATNLVGDSYLEQMEQASGFLSTLSDPATGQLREGSLLVFAPDGKQRVPSDAGKDGVLFTDDDPVAPVAKGYTLLRIGRNGKVTRDRSRFTMDLLEAPAEETPDYSAQGILGSYSSLLALLAERYAYTELRHIDWNAVRAAFLPRVKELDGKNDLPGYYRLLHDLANSIRDGHVQVVASYALKGEFLKLRGQLWTGSLGATLKRLSDDRVVVASTGAGSPADKAGVTVGTEVTAVDGRPIAEHLARVPQVGFPGTEERALAWALMKGLSFPTGQPVELSVKRPGESAVTAVRLTAEECEGGATYSYPKTLPLPFEWRHLADGMVGYARWDSFEKPEYNIAGWEQFLSAWSSAPGIIVDLRGNGGGLETLMYTMASYLFAEDKAVPVRWLDYYSYDAAKKAFVKAPPGADLRIHSPRPWLTFGGHVVVLVDGGTASAAEFLAQYLQKVGRAVVIAEEGTSGAGGGLRQVNMPGKMVFTYTGDRRYFAGTREVNIEGKGVTADVRVPITEANERRKLAGEDVVLSTAVEYLKARFPKPEAGAK